MKQGLRTGFIFLCAIIFHNASSSQSVTGVPGYVRIPVATFNDDGTLVFGTSFLPKQHLSYSGYTRDAVAAYASLTFLSFVEVDLRVTRQLNMPENNHHIMDRVPTIRFRILKEKKWIPAVALGFHDILTSVDNGNAHHFGATYLVATKNLHFEKSHTILGVTAGWGASRLIWKNDEFKGFFGGISVGCDKAPWVNLLCDYDGKTVNTALRFICFKRLWITAGTMNFDSFTGTVSYRFKLIR